MASPRVGVAQGQDPRSVVTRHDVGYEVGHGVTHSTDVKHSVSYWCSSYQIELQPAKNGQGEGSLAQKEDLQVVALPMEPHLVS